MFALNRAGTDGEEGSGGHKTKTKRVRTSFTEDQLRVLHANFRIDNNPDGQDQERIAQQTGLSKRVTQVPVALVCLLFDGCLLLFVVWELDHIAQQTGL